MNDIKNEILNGDDMNNCELCKHYKECSKNIYDANIERKYLIFWSGRDCWEANK